VLAGRVLHELACVAVSNEESERILAERTIEGMRPKAGTIHLAGKGNANITNGFIQPGTVQSQAVFQGFIVSVNEQKVWTEANSAQKDVGNAGKAKAANQDTKTARMPQNELLDLIFACFRRFQYWSMKALRAELHQPEAYLRETLDKIAEMPKSGRFAMHWTLKPEIKNATGGYEGADDASAPMDALAEGAEDSDMGDVDGEDEDEDVKMEDVLPQ
jgi:transcription initiation factor TFIIF subunit beta